MSFDSDVSLSLRQKMILLQREIHLRRRQRLLDIASSAPSAGVYPLYPHAWTAKCTESTLQWLQLDPTILYRIDKPTTHLR